MAGYDDLSGDSVKAVVSLVMGGVAKEGMPGGAWSEFVVSCGREVWITFVTENA